MAYAHRSDKTKKLTGKWRADVCYKLPNGDEARHHRLYDTKQEAEGVEAYIRATGTLPPHVVGLASGRTFAVVAGEFQSSREGGEWLAAHDGKTNAQRLQFAIDHIGLLDIKHLRTRQLEQYRDKVLARAGKAGLPPANRTVNYYLDAVGKVFEFALDHDDLEERPKMPRMKNEGEYREALRWDQEDTLVFELERKGRHDIAFVVRVLAATGMRAGELHGLSEGQILTPEQDENCGIMLGEKQTKTNAARWVPILRPAAVKLRSMIAHGRLPNAAQVYTAFKLAAQGLGDDQSFCVHSLRHTTVTRLLESGANPTDVAKITGHIVPGTVKMQLRYYHPEKATLYKVAEKVQPRLGENPNKSTIVSLNPSERSVASA